VGIRGETSPQQADAMVAQAGEAGLDRRPLSPPLGREEGKADADVWGVGRRWPPLATLSQLPSMAQNPLLARRFLKGPFQIPAGPDGPLPALHRAAGSMNR
jgi:hypothetical protein